jgi:hypothetical protein
MNTKKWMMLCAFLAVVVACAVSSGCTSLGGNGDGPRGTMLIQYENSNSTGVYIDGQYAGVAPSAIHAYYPGMSESGLMLTVKTGTHTVKITAQGCKDYVETVTVTEGGETDIFGTCTAPSGTVNSSIQ